jgi:hypothetical protein
MIVYREDRATLGTPSPSSTGSILRIPAYVARAGVQVYQTAGGRERREWRPVAEVFRTDALAALAGAPVTHHHPPVMVTATNRAQYERGYVGREITRDGAKVGATLYIVDAYLIAAIKSGDAREISLGYHVDVDDEPGIVPYGEPDAGQRYDAIQRCIRINHCAVVPQGRAGSDVRVRL